MPGVTFARTNQNLIPDAAETVAFRHVMAGSGRNTALPVHRPASAPQQPAGLVHPRCAVHDSAYAPRQRTPLRHLLCIRYDQVSAYE
jgi:hypothetical protein